MRRGGAGKKKNIDSEHRGEREEKSQTTCLVLSLLDPGESLLWPPVL